MTEADIITRAIEASGQSARVFARYILGRDERTVQRWRAGAPIPPVALAWLEYFLALGSRERDKVVALLVPQEERQSA